jgi:hypothetical protein
LDKGIHVPALFVVEPGLQGGAGNKNGTRGEPRSAAALSDAPLATHLPHSYRAIFMPGLLIPAPETSTNDKFLGRGNDNDYREKLMAE